MKRNIKKEEVVAPGKRVFNHHIRSLNDFMAELGYEMHISSSSIFYELKDQPKKRCLRATKRISLTNAVRLHNHPVCWALTTRSVAGIPIVCGHLFGHGEIFSTLPQLNSAMEARRIKTVRLYHVGGKLCLHSLTNKKEDDYVYNMALYQRLADKASGDSE